MGKVLLFALMSISVFSQPKKFDEYNQKILGQDYNLVMIPLAKGEFLMGSPQNEINRMAPFIRSCFFKKNIKFFNKIRLKSVVNFKLQIYKNHNKKTLNVISTGFQPKT